VERNVERRAQCSPVMALGWLANTDLQPAVIYKGLILYVCEVYIEARNQICLILGVAGLGIIPLNICRGSNIL
jgi:hypothetical protein